MCHLLEAHYNKNDELAGRCKLILKAKKLVNEGNLPTYPKEAKFPAAVK